MKRFLRKNFSELLSWRNLIKDLRRRYVIPQKRKVYNYCHDSAILEMPFDISNYKNISIGPYTKIRKGFIYLGNKGTFTLKKYSAIAMNCIVVTDGHTPTLRVPHIIGGILHINDKVTDVIVNEGVWIGMNCILLPGTKIGRGAIIGAGSLVNKEIPPYAVAVGVPAKIIASTFTIDEILIHEETLYPPEERFTRKELENIFEKNFLGKKSIGHSSVPQDISSELEKRLFLIRNSLDK